MKLAAWAEDCSKELHKTKTAPQEDRPRGRSHKPTSKPPGSILAPLAKRRSPPYPLYRTPSPTLTAFTPKLQDPVHNWLESHHLLFHSLKPRPATGLSSSFSHPTLPTTHHRLSNEFTLSTYDPPISPNNLTELYLSVINYLHTTYHTSDHIPLTYISLSEDIQLCQ